MSDERIGMKNSDGSIAAWPRLTISGLEYNRPCTMLGLDENHFVVVDMWPVRDYLDEVDRLKDAIKGMSAPPKKVKVNDGA